MLFGISIATLSYEANWQLGTRPVYPVYASHIDPRSNGSNMCRFHVDIK